MIISVGLDNKELYEGCDIIEVGGRLSLTTDPALASNIVGRNAQQLVECCAERDQVTLTGAMAQWVYLIVFHIVVHQFKKVYYEDGRGLRLLLAQH